jgi:hypothetical protein
LETFALVVGSISVIPFWLLMIALPHWKITRRICRQHWIVAPPIVFYILLLFDALISGRIITMLTTNLLDPTSLAALLAIPSVAVGAWLHLLAFDLWVGRWIYLDSREKGLNAFAVSLILVLVLCFGPLGLATYLVWQFATRRNPSREYSGNPLQS